MTAKFEHENLVLKSWLLVHRTVDLLRACEDRVLREYNLTTEQYAVLISIRYLGYTNGCVRPTDIARWLAHSPNSISMIADRMVKAGLLRRQRDRHDRRVVHLVITSKGEEALKPATAANWEFVQKIYSQVSHEDGQTLVRLLETLEYAASAYLNPGADIEAIIRNEVKSRDKLMERLIQYHPLSTPEAKRRPQKK